MAPAVCGWRENTPPRSASALLIPPLFAVGLVAFPLLSLLFTPLWYLFLGLYGLYLAAVLVSSLGIALRHGAVFIWLAPPIFVTVHLGLGWGFLRELFTGRKRDAKEMPEMTKKWRLVLLVSLIGNLTIAYVAYKAYDYRSSINYWLDKYLYVVDEFSGRARYESTNGALKSDTIVPGRIVFLGTQVIEEWPLAEYFPGI